MVWHVTNSNLVQSHVTNSNLVQSHVTNSNVVQSHVTNSNLVQSHVTNSNVVQSHVTNSNLVQSHVTNSNLVQSHVTNQMWYNHMSQTQMWYNHMSQTQMWYNLGGQVLSIHWSCHLELPSSLCHAFSSLSYWVRPLLRTDFLSLPFSTIPSPVMPALVVCVCVCGVCVCVCVCARVCAHHHPVLLPSWPWPLQWSYTPDMTLWPHPTSLKWPQGQLQTQTYYNPILYSPPPPPPIPTTSQDLCCVPGLCQWQLTQTCYNPTLCSTPTYLHRIYVEFQGFVNGSLFKPATIPPFTPSPPPPIPAQPTVTGFMWSSRALSMAANSNLLQSPPLSPSPPPPPTYLHRIYVEFQGFVNGSQLKPATIPPFTPSPIPAQPTVTGFMWSSRALSMAAYSSLLQSHPLLPTIPPQPTVTGFMLSFRALKMAANTSLLQSHHLTPLRPLSPQPTVTGFMLSFRALSMAAYSSLLQSPPLSPSPPPPQPTFTGFMLSSRALSMAAKTNL